MRSLFPFFLALLILGPSCARDSARNRQPSLAYLQLLEKFPPDDQGLSKEPTFPDIQEQPLTYALLLTAESLRYKASPTEEGRTRVRNATEWLVSNQSLSDDGKPGWGLPDAWDAFGDGTVNPPNQSYTFTTAMVMLAIMDSESIQGFWTDSDRSKFRLLLKEVALRWVHEVYTVDSGGSFLVQHQYQRCCLRDKRLRNNERGHIQALGTISVSFYKFGKAINT